MEREPEHQNPFASPVDGPESEADASNPVSYDDLRLSYLPTENLIRSFSLVWYLQAAVIASIALAVVVAFVFGAVRGALPYGAIVVGLVGATPIGALAYFFWWLARGMRILDQSVRVYASGLAFLGLLNFPVGTAACGYYLLCAANRKGEYAYSEEYQQVVKATPHLKWQTNYIVLAMVVVMGLSQFLLLLGLLLMFTGALRP